MGNKTPNWQPTKAEYWHNLPSPARPWPSEVSWFEKYALEKKAEGKLNVLILGSTVEFRSMLHKNGLNVYVVDFSKEFYNILTETQKDKMEYTGKEIFYEENWVTMNLGKKFDLIFGDWVPGVLHTKDYNSFFKRIIEHLEDDGLFVAREGLSSSDKPIDMEKVVLEHYSKYADKYSFFQSSMQFVYGFEPDPETYMWNITKATEALENVHDKGLFKKESDYEEMRDALAIEKDGSASMMTEEVLENEIKKYLDITAKHHVEEPSSNLCPVYVMKKINSN